MAVAGHRLNCLCESCNPERRGLHLSERELVETWRLKVLIDAGYSVSVAEKVAASAADLHQAVDLVKQGCRPAVAALILL